MPNWIDLTNSIPIDPSQLKAGQVLGFRKVGMLRRKMTRFKIMRIKDGKVWGKEVELLTPEQMEKKLLKQKKLVKNGRARKTKTDRNSKRL